MISIVPISFSFTIEIDVIITQTSISTSAITPGTKFCAPFSWGLYIADQGVVLPLANTPDQIEKVLKVIKEFAIHAIVPGTEIEAEVLVNNSSLIPVPIISNKKEINEII